MFGFSRGKRAAAVAVFGVPLLIVAGIQSLGLAGAEPPESRPVAVPSDLRQRVSSIEMSGIVWCPQLDRYLVVTDDTAVGGGKKAHRPYVLAMDRDGQLDAEPVLIDGVDQINDPEAVTGGPDGTFFLATSHSQNRSGRTRDERRMLLHLQVAGRALRVMARLDLWHPIAATVGPGALIDLEGLAFRDGALYLGLKSPLTSSGSALILRLDNAVAALHAGRVERLERMTEVSLAVNGPSGRVFQGISDLAFLPDGSAALTANAPKGGPADGGGALWMMPAGKGAVPRLVQRYSGLKPEGVTVSPDGSRLVVVFDRGQEPPAWGQWPLPR